MAGDEGVEDGLVEGHLARLHVLQDRRGARHVAHVAEPGTSCTRSLLGYAGHLNVKISDSNLECCVVIQIKII